AMDSPSGWQRDTVQRLLFERAERAANEPLLRLPGLTHAPQVRLQALATLGHLGTLTAETLIAALRDPHPEVRGEALRQSEAFADKNAAIFPVVATLTSDGNAAVRQQAAFSLGAWPSEKSEPWLRDLAAREVTNEVLRFAIMSS